MKVLLFGATGMIGQGVLRECLASDAVTRVRAVARSELPAAPKLETLVHADMFELPESAFDGIDLCLFCLGVSSAGMSEADYARITYDLTLAIAKQLLARSPKATFIYVSGGGTDTKSRSMWARVKGRTEDALLELPFERAYMFRPGFIQPLHGIRSKTWLYRAVYALPLYPILRRIAPSHVTTTEQVGRAMLAVAERGHALRVLETEHINAL